MQDIMEVVLQDLSGPLKQEGIEIGGVPGERTLRRGEHEQSIYLPATGGKLACIKEIADTRHALDFLRMAT